MSDLIKSIASIEGKFNSLSSSHGAVNFAQEANFARQLLESNPYLSRIAEGNQRSLFNAVLNIASIGVSLNPASAHAYLVPRKGSICLDISYRGICHLAQETGSIRWVQAYIVYGKDTFQENEIGQLPKFIRETFSKDRGEKIGVFCTAKTSDGDVLTHTMNIDEVYAIRDKSEGYKAAIQKGRQSPWTEHENEMIKKTCIKQAAKLWPRSERSTRLDEAIKTENDINGIDFDSVEKEKPEPVDHKKKNELLNELTEICADQTSGMSPEEKMKFMNDKLGVKQFEMLKRKKIEEIESIINKLLGENDE